MGYGGLLGAFPYAFRESDSWLFRAYVVVGGLLAAFVAALFALALVVQVFRTAGVGGGTFTFSRAFFILVGFLVVVPLVAPVLFVARRHRRETAREGFDARMALAGFLYVGTLVLGALLAGTEAPRPGPLAPVVGALHDAPAWLGAVPPLLGALAVLYLGRR